MLPKFELYMPDTMEEACRDAWNWQSQNPFGYDGPVL